MFNTDSELLIKEIVKALQTLQYGSVEIIVQDKTVTQITVRNITKTSINMKNRQSISNTKYESMSTRKKIDVLTMQD